MLHKFELRYEVVGATKNICWAKGEVEVIRVTGLVSLFNGISTFVGYLMPKPFS